MALKGNQQKNSVNHNASSRKKKGSNSASVAPDTTRQGRDSKVEVFPGEELPNGTHSGTPLMDSLSKSHSTGDESIRKQNSGTSPRIENQGTDARLDPESSVSSETTLGDHTEYISSRQTCGVGVENVRRGRKNRKSGLGWLLNRLHVKSVMENTKFSDNVLVRSFREYVASISKVTIELLETHKPLFATLTTYAYNTRNYVLTKIQPVYRVVLNYLTQFAKIMLLLSMLWLHCTIRGIDSFLRMGTTSFFSVIWCSVLSVIAMVGMLKVFMVLVIAASVALFIGLALAIIVIAISGTVFLWFYGSFWTTVLIICLGGLGFKFTNERLALFITTVYSLYCAWSYVGWLGLLLALNLSFISNDALILFLKNNIDHHERSDGPPEQIPGMQGGPGLSADHNARVPATSGTDSEGEVVRLLKCTDHYSALGLTRFHDVDVSVLKREYRKKAMLVHPDKNMGNEKAAEAFKKLQNAYEVLLDSFKRKAYDDELRRQELLKVFHNFQSDSQKNGRHGFFASGSVHPNADGEDLMEESRQIFCKKCNSFHVWLETKKSKSQARWCQECKDYHQAKEGDGWVEQSSQPFFFGLLQKVDVPCAYICAGSRIYNATEWYICQGMRCPANTHKPTFHVNTSVTSKHSSGKGTSSAQRGGRMPTANLEETMTEEEFFEWLQKAMQSGMFENFGGGTSAESPINKAGSGSKSNGAGNSSSGSKRKKKGKKQW